MNYDPNMVSSGRMALQTVKLTFQVWEYSAEREVIVGGNCTGLAVIDAAVESLFEDLPDSPDYSKSVPYIELESPAGVIMVCDDEDDRGEDWLKSMLVKAEIVDIQPDNRVAA